MRKQPMRNGGVVALFLALGASALFSGSACGRKDAAPTPSEDQRPRVVVARVSQKSVPIRLDYVGNVMALESADIKARVTGYVMSYHFREGEDVAKDQLLFTIDPRPFEAALAEAQGKLSENLAELAYARAQVTRYAGLARDEFISKDDYSRYVSTAEALRAAVKKDRAAVRLAQLNLGYCSIRAPFAGRAGRRLIDPGNLVTSSGGPSDPTLVVIKQIDPIKVIFAVPEQDLLRIRETERVGLQVAVPGKSKAPLEGELWLIDNAVNTASGMVEMEGMLPNPETQLWPGQFVNVSLEVATLPDAIVVPSVALSLGQVGSYVFIVNEKGTVSKRPVETGSVIGRETLVQAGLRPGERVVTEGKVGLQSGLQVEVAP